MGSSNTDLFHKNNTLSLSLSLSLNCVEFLIENIKWEKEEEAKTRLENNVKHEMGWIEKMNTRFEKQKMSLENEK